MALARSKLTQRFMATRLGKVWYMWYQRQVKKETPPAP